MQAIDCQNSLSDTRLQATQKTFPNIGGAYGIRIQLWRQVLRLARKVTWEIEGLSPQQHKERENMKKMLLSIALAVVAPFAWGQVSETTTTTTTTEGNGTITEYTPGSQIVLRESTGPRTYRFGKTVTYVTRSGKVLDADTVRTRVKVGVPVRVHYAGTGDSMMVDRVIVDED
jgi:hypothetical protein